MNSTGSWRDKWQGALSVNEFRRCGAALVPLARRRRWIALALVGAIFFLTAGKIPESTPRVVQSFDPDSAALENDRTDVNLDVFRWSESGGHPVEGWRITTVGSSERRAFAAPRPPGRPRISSAENSD